MELGIDTDHPINNGGFSCSRSPSEDKDLVLNRLVNRLVDFLRVKWSFFTLLQQSANVTANPFFRKEKAIVKDLGIHILDLVFLDEVA